MTCVFLVDLVVVQVIVIVYLVAIVRVTLHGVVVNLVIVIVRRLLVDVLLTGDVVPGTGSAALDLDLQLGRGWDQNGAQGHVQGQGHELDGSLIHCHATTSSHCWRRSLVPNHRLQRQYQFFHRCLLQTKVHCYYDCAPTWLTEWHDGAIGRASDLQFIGCGFEFWLCTIA